MDISPIKSEKIYKKKWFKIALIVVLILLVGGCAVAFKTGYILNKVSTSGGLLESLMKSVPGVNNELKGEKEGRINIALLGMRGENIPGGGLLADTIMVLSVKPAENKASLVSVPRDLYVTVPGTGDKQKINAVHFYGEEKNKNGGGLEYMEKILGEVSGQTIHYAVSINFAGFKELIDALGGVQIHLDEPFSESLQFMGLEQRCDSDTLYTIPSGNVETKKVTRKDGSVGYRHFKLCLPREQKTENLECGGNFTLPAGDSTLNGDQALCYVRSRVTSNDFERARRQQQVLKSMKDKALSAGTLADFGKINTMLDSLGNNVRTDMKLWEMKRFFEIYKSMSNLEISQKVLENTAEGLLYHPENTTPEQGYILLPIGDNYDKIKELFQQII